MNEELESELFEDEPLEADLNADAEEEWDDDYEDEDYEDDMSEQEYRDYLDMRQAEYDDQFPDYVEFPSYTV